MTARILIIEDNADNLDLMVYLLVAGGYAIATARDGHEGLAMVRAEPPDLIVCDVQMAGLDGYGVARALAGDPDLARIPVIAVTSLAMVGDREKVLAAGFDGYLTKPITPEIFVQEVASYLPAALRVRHPEPS